MRPGLGNPLCSTFAVWRACAPFAFLLLAGAAFAQTNLRWRLAPGERWQLHLSQTSATEADIAGQTYKSSLKMRAILDWRVVEVDAEGAAMIDQTLSQLSLAIELPGAEPVRYDSTSQQTLTGAAKAVADEFRPWVGKTVRLRLTATGRVSDASGASTRDPSQSMDFRPGEVQQLLGRLLPPLSPEPIAPGETWGDRRELVTPQGRVQVSSRFKLRGPEPVQPTRLERIEATYQFDAGAPHQDVTLAFEDQNHRGRFLFDSAAGRLVRGEIRQSMTLRLTVEGAQASQRATSEMQIEVRPAF
jgi:hypothetical protein